MPNERIAILSCVGQRALAVVNPINTLLRTSLPDKVTVTLLSTPEVRKVVDHTKTWLERNFQQLQVKSLPFSKHKEAIKELSSMGDKIYFNVNPGMNWQVALLSLSVPDETICFGSDTEYLYWWSLMKGADSAQLITLHNMGISSYTELSGDLSIETTRDIRSTLSEKVQNCLKKLPIYQSYFVSKKGIPGNLTQKMNNHLIWVRENRGFLHLLFDLCGKETPDLRNLFRLLTAVFSPLDFPITIVTDNKMIHNRATFDGIDSIYISKADWEGGFIEWIKEAKNNLPKRKMADITLAPLRDTHDFNTGKALFVCLGDNVLPTLKAIHSHSLERVILFYDGNSPRIKYLARKINSELTAFKMRLQKTDHRGKGIIKFCDNYTGSTISHFNITPGTKMQAVMLAVAARKKGVLKQVYSINNDTDSIETVVDAKDSFRVIAPEITETIRFQMASLNRAQEQSFRHEFWDLILMELADQTLKPAPFILELSDNNGKVCRKINEDEILFRNERFKIDRSFFFEGNAGSWWEAAVTQAVATNISNEVYMQMAWGWKKGKQFLELSEFDVVFPYKGYVGVVSCKAGKFSIGDLNEEVYLVKSEAQKRFGRFALPFVAIPWEKKGDQEIAGITISGVKILTPKVLVDKESLILTLEYFIEDLRSTKGKPSKIVEFI